MGLKGRSSAHRILIPPGLFLAPLYYLGSTSLIFSSTLCFYHKQHFLSGHLLVLHRWCCGQTVPFPTALSQAFPFTLLWLKLWPPTKYETSSDYLALRASLLILGVIPPWYFLSITMTRTRHTNLFPCNPFLTLSSAGGVGAHSHMDGELTGELFMNHVKSMVGKPLTQIPPWEIIVTSWDSPGDKVNDQRIQCFQTNLVVVADTTYPYIQDQVWGKA